MQNERRALCAVVDPESQARDGHGAQTHLEPPLLPSSMMLAPQRCPRGRCGAPRRRRCLYSLLHADGLADGPEWK